MLIQNEKEEGQDYFLYNNNVFIYKLTLTMTTWVFRNVPQNAKRIFIFYLLFKLYPSILVFFYFGTVAGKIHVKATTGISP